MENQHRKITGYRDLSQVEIDLMNRIKAKGKEVLELINELESYRSYQIDSDTINSENSYESGRCLKISREKLQTGFMWLVRAVALPKSF